jgi:hypothetical protein
MVEFSIHQCRETLSSVSRIISGKMDSKPDNGYKFRYVLLTPFGAYSLNSEER